MTALDDVPQADLALVADARQGQREAFAELYRRHYDPAFRYALSLTRGNEALAQDIVAEAFVQVLRVTFEGRGSTVAFRPYLFSAVRHEFLAEQRRSGRVALVDDADQLDSPTRPDEDADGSDPVIASAFSRLPARWRTVLWHMEIQGDRPAELASYMGISANAVAALASRAREGLRQEYLQEQVQRRRPECQPYASRLGRLVRGGLSRRERRNLEEHLTECTDCAQARVDLTNLNERLQCGLPVLGAVGPLLLAPAAGTTGAGASGVAASGAAGSAVSGAVSSVTSGGAAGSGIAASGCVGSIGASSGALGGAAVVAGTAGAGAVGLAPVGMAAGLAIASAAAVLGLSGVKAPHDVPELFPAAVATVSNESADAADPVPAGEDLPAVEPAAADGDEPEIDDENLVAGSDGSAAEVLSDRPVEVTAEPTSNLTPTAERTLSTPAGEHTLSTPAGDSSGEAPATGSGRPAPDGTPTGGTHRGPSRGQHSEVTTEPTWTGEPGNGQSPSWSGGPTGGSTGSAAPWASDEPSPATGPPSSAATGDRGAGNRAASPQGKHARPSDPSGPPEWAGPGAKPPGKHARR